MADRPAANEPQLSPREQQLLSSLEEIKQGCRELSAALSTQAQAMASKEAELTQLRRSIIELKEENSHLREVLQTWSERMDNVLTQLRGLN